MKLLQPSQRTALWPSSETHPAPKRIVLSSAYCLPRDWLARSSANTLPYLLYLLIAGESCLKDAHRRTGWLWLFNTRPTGSRCRAGSAAMPGWPRVEATATATATWPAAP